jgi:hypothetical protein
MSSYSLSEAYRACDSYANSRESFQRVALSFVVTQTLNANADAATLVFRRAGLLLPNNEVTADGRAVFQWLCASPADGGCGLKGILRWDSESSSFKMVKDCGKTVDSLDLIQVRHNLNAVLWYVWKRTTTPAKKAFDLDARILRLVKDAGKAGITPAQIESALRRAMAVKTA